jgi:putative redox protein
MEITLKRIADPYKQEATNERGNSVILDAGPKIGGKNEGFRPMELVLTGLAGCASFDAIHILNKQRQVLKDIRITVTGEREEGAIPSPFIAMHIHFTLIGEVDEAKAKRALDLAVNKYCSVGAMLGKSGPITHTFEIKTEA